MVVIGFKRNNFKSKDGEEVKGYNLYCKSYTILEGGEGEACERIYVSEKRLTECGYTPNVGDEIEVLYNRFGKVAAVNLL